MTDVFELIFAASLEYTQLDLTLEVAKIGEGQIDYTCIFAEPNIVFNYGEQIMYKFYRQTHFDKQYFVEKTKQVIEWIRKFD